MTTTARSLLQLYKHTYIKLTAGEVIGNSIIMVIDIAHPVIRIDIIYIEKIESIDPEPYIAQVALKPCAVGAILVVKQAIGHSNIDTLICRSIKGVLLAPGMRRPERQAIGVCTLKAHFPAVGAGEEIGKI